MLFCYRLVVLALPSGNSLENMGRQRQSYQWSAREKEVRPCLPKTFQTFPIGDRKLFHVLRNDGNDYRFCPCIVLVNASMRDML